MQCVATTMEGSGCLPTRIKQYQEVVGQLLWVSNTARLDISYTIRTLARYMSSPTNSAWNAAIHILKYLNQMTGRTKHTYGQTCCYVHWHKLGIRPYQWMQEYIRGSYIHVWVSGQVYCHIGGNKRSTVLLLSTQGFRSQRGQAITTHRQPRMHSDHVQEGDVDIDFVRTASNVADILTKPLKGVEKTQLAKLIGLEMSSGGGVKDTTKISKVA
ncbi:hypothetical protein NDA10_003431 [Ustilago hordei]|nr:hypothetical protein NDA10_003431 [Ustilago hordei]